MNKTEYLLVCLAEECAEVAQRATKTLRFGWDEVQLGQESTNLQRLKGELNDLRGVLESLDELGFNVSKCSRKEINTKKARIIQYMGYSRLQGTLR